MKSEEHRATGVCRFVHRRSNDVEVSLALRRAPAAAMIQGPLPDDVGFNRI